MQKVKKMNDINSMNRLRCHLTDDFNNLFVSLVDYNILFNIENIFMFKMWMSKFGNKNYFTIFKKNVNLGDDSDEY